MIGPGGACDGCWVRTGRGVFGFGCGDGMGGRCS